MRIIALFNLKEGVDAQAYDEWARSAEIPGVRSLVSVDDFTIYHATGLLGSDARPRYGYIQIIDVNDMERFGVDMTSEAVRKIMTEFDGFATDAQFILTERLPEVR